MGLPRTGSVSVTGRVTVVGSSVSPGADTGAIRGLVSTAPVDAGPDIRAGPATGANPDSVGPDSVGPDSVGLGRAGLGRAGLGRAGLGRAGLGRAGPAGAGPDGAGADSAVAVDAGPVSAAPGGGDTGLGVVLGGDAASGCDLGVQGSSSGRALTIIAGADTGSAGRGGNFGTARNG
ncbi:hypothetical protein GCM10010484_37810 [Actinokineospora globicatena]